MPTTSHGIDPSSQPTGDVEKLLDLKHKMQQKVIWEDLQAQVKGTLSFLDSESSWKAFKLFNSASRPLPSSNGPITEASAVDYPRQAVLCPKSSQDVLAAMDFAHKSGIEISVKSGGYNPSSWSTRGTLILDLKELKSVIVHPHNDHETLKHGTGDVAMHVEPTVHERTREELTSTGVRISNPADPTPSSISTAATSNSQKRKHSPSSPEPNMDSAMPPAGSENFRSGNSRQPSASTSTDSSTSSGDATPPLQTMLAQQAQDNVNASLQNGQGVSDKGKRRMLDSDRADATQSQQNGSSRQHFIHANAYPPFNLVNADPEQERAFHQRRRSQDGSIPGPALDAANGAHANDNDQLGASIPFIYDPIRKETVFPGNAPPGTVPFSSSAISSASQAQAGTMGVASTDSPAADPNTAWPTVAAGSRMNPGSSSLSNNGRSDGSSRPHASRALSTSPVESAFGAADPSDYNLVSFGSGTTAHHLDSVTSTSAFVPSNNGTEANEIARNDAGIECFVPWACYPVGSAIFLTGGYGFVSRLYGLSMDLVTGLEIVLPPTSPRTSARAQSTNGPPPLVDGELNEKARIVTLKVDYANDPELTQEEKAEQEELWWACRGAGTAFGIVTNITCKAYNIGQVLAGNVIFPFNPITTPSLLKHWRDCLKVAPRELYTNFTLTAGPSERGHVVVIQFSWCGKKIAEGEEILQTMLSWDGERCLLKDVEVRPYKHQQENVSQILSSKDDTRWLVRSTLLNSLSDTSINKTIDVFRNCQPGASWLFETASGAIAEPHYPSCFPMDHRKAPFQVAALHQWTNPQDDEIQRKSAEGWVYDVLKDDSCGPFPCFLSSGENKDRIEAVYGRENFERLKALKKKYDPHCLLKHTHFEETLNGE